MLFLLPLLRCASLSLKKPVYGDSNSGPQWAPEVAIELSVTTLWRESPAKCHLRSADSTCATSPVGFACHLHLTDCFSWTPLINGSSGIWHKAPLDEAAAQGSSNGRRESMSPRSALHSPPDTAVADQIVNSAAAAGLTHPAEAKWEGAATCMRALADAARSLGCLQPLSHFYPFSPPSRSVHQPGCRCHWDLHQNVEHRFASWADPGVGKSDEQQRHDQSLSKLNQCLK